MIFYVDAVMSNIRKGVSHKLVAEPVLARYMSQPRENKITRGINRANIIGTNFK